MAEIRSFKQVLDNYYYDDIYNAIASFIDDNPSRIKSNSSVVKRVEQAILYYLKAAQQGILPAIEKLSDMYANGTGTKKDINKAFEYNEKIRENGNHNAEMRYLRLIRERAAINS